MVVEKKPTEAAKPADKTAKTSKDTKQPEETAAKDAKKPPVVENEDLVSILLFFMRKSLLKNEFFYLRAKKIDN